MATQQASYDSNFYHFLEGKPAAWALTQLEVILAPAPGLLIISQSRVGAFLGS